MGLLDDAIREHLELKRRHGAAEEEVRRIESEALGPVRREPAAAEPAAEDAEPAPVPPEPAAVEPEPTVAEHAVVEPAALAEPEPEPAPAPQPESRPAGPEPPARAAADPTPRGFTDNEPWLDDPDEVPSADALDHPRRGQPTTEFTAEEVAEAEGEAEYVAPDEEPAEDVLEETPEFLQETPEHDRLWFEQKPPRDFDFNE